jgi:hypothetical protein
MLVQNALVKLSQQATPFAAFAEPDGFSQPLKILPLDPI